MGATCLTHPLDTVKVQLQTQKEIRFGFFGWFISKENRLSWTINLNNLVTKTRHD